MLFGTKNWDQNTDLKMTAFQNKYWIMLTTAQKSHISPKQMGWFSMTVLNKQNDSLRERQLWVRFNQSWSVRANVA